MRAKAERMRTPYLKAIGLLPVFASLVAIVALYALDISFLYEPKYLLGVTNTIFTLIIPVVVAFFAARTYLKTGSLSVLLMGCGMLGFGLCAGSAGWLRGLHGGANFNVTVYNTGALLGSLCHFAGAIINTSRKSHQWQSGPQTLTVIPSYSAILIFTVLLSFATVQKVIPPFFVQGTGPTAIRQVVLGLSIFLYAVSSLFFMNNYLRIRSDFLYWYSLCLAMLALGLFAFYVQKIVGSPIGWVGRTSNYVGTIFSLIAILAAVRSAKSRGLPLEEIISGFFVDAEANYRSLVETAPDAIISFDQENRIILCNSSAEQIFGYSKGEAIGSPVFGTLIPEEHENTLTELIEAGDSGSSQRTVEIVARRKNGGLFPIEISAFGRRVPNGRVSTCILRDITERKRMEDDLRRAHGELELRVQERTAELSATVARLELINQELQEFAHVAAHDLQEPLRKIQTFCDMARQRCAPVLDSTSKDYLDRVINSANRMRQLLRGLLEFSKAAARPESFNEVDLAKVVREAADAFEVLVEETGCQIIVGSLPVIEADESQMLRLFENVIGNSLKFRGGGTPRISVRGGLDAQGRCEIFVEDNGIGFAPQFAEIIFKPFQKLHARGFYEGTGIGLAICRKIVERHGGSIRAESEPGKGSTFIISLPAKQTRFGNINAGQIA